MGSLGAFIGIIIGLTLFYPFILSFPNKLFIVLFELYLVIFLGIGFYKVFDVGFTNYINYKSIFHNNGMKVLLRKINFALTFYFLGVILFIYFIFSF